MTDEKILIAALKTKRGKEALKKAMLGPIISKQPHPISEPTKESVLATLEIVNRKLENPKDWDEETLKACAWMKPRLERWLGDQNNA